jgi:hypothetical protein
VQRAAIFGSGKGPKEEKIRVDRTKVLFRGIEKMTVSEQYRLRIA